MATEFHADIPVDEKYIFEDSSKRKALMAIFVGIGLVILGIALFYLLPHSSEHGGHSSGHHEHGASLVKIILSNLWLNNVFFTGIAIIGVFFVAFQFVAQAGWSSSIIRIPQSFGYFLPITGVLMLLVFVGSLFVGHEGIFHWTHPGIMEEDKVIAGKSGYLNVPFFLIRMVVYFSLWYWIFLQLRKLSLAEDLDKNVKYYEKQSFWSIIFIIVFAVTSSTSAWDWVLSLDTHWFSTMFGWYVFASWFVTGLAVITLTIVFLKEAGYLKIVNASHLHDLGKFMFAFSIFWTYIWFSQFMLIQYTGIPEETIRYYTLLYGFDKLYQPAFFINLIANFAFPFLWLMTRDAKRHLILLKVAAFGIIIGHWLDFYLMVMPFTLGAKGGISFIELGFVSIYAGGFILVVGNNLSKALLIPKNHPMLQESIHHDI